MCIDVFCLYACLCEDVRSPGGGVTNSFELPRGTVLYEAASACIVSYLHFLFLGELSMVGNVSVPRDTD